MDPIAAALDALVACDRPLLIGVRHHSAACAAAVPALLDAFAPERVLVELPEELQPWLPWLGHAGLQPPVALAGATDDGALAFYPFAEFSPELAAVRWAVARGVPIEAFDLPIARRTGHEREAGDQALLGALLHATGAPDVEAMWDRLVEARAPGATPQQVRRAALGVGLALRRAEVDGGGVSEVDLLREAHMRSRLSGARAAAVVGAFHAAALLPEPLLWRAPTLVAEPGPAPTTSLVPYADDLLDSRSGYPAGIRDPQWQRRAWAALAGDGTLEDAVVELAVAICRALREAGHVAGTPDAAEVARLARGLAAVRGLPAPGRRELLEGVESALGHGELLGRGRAVARAAESVLVGRRRGVLAPGTPRSGLAPHVEGLLAALGLPGPTSPPDPVRMRLDPLRADIDRRRHTVLVRLEAIGVPYGQREESGVMGDVETLTEVWRMSWRPATAATLELGAARGVTLEQAAAGALRAERARLAAGDLLGAAARLSLTARAAACGLPDLLREGLADLMGPFLAEAGLTELLDAFALVERLRRKHVPALPDDFECPAEVRAADLLAAAVRAVEGLAGSDSLDDARALLALVRLFERDAADLGTSRLGAALDALARDGAPVIAGAAEAIRALTGREPAEHVGERLGAWIDAAVDNEGRRTLAGRLGGALTVAAPLFEASPAFVGGLLDRVEALDDDAFLSRLPALRDGFDALSPAARGRLLDVLAERLGGDAPETELEDPPELLALYAAADRGGAVGEPRAAPTPLPDFVLALAAAFEHGAARPRVAQTPGVIGPRDRWRLILGRERSHLSGMACRAARALDELYGTGRGEGARGEGGGHDAPFPTVREWAGELEDLFGERVREEVLGRAAEGGNGAAALELDPAHVAPSVELLEELLALKGALPPGQMEHLRRLVRRVVEQLTEALATRIRPALTGLSTPIPTRRPGGPLDLGRTLRANLKHVRRDGRVVCERLVFRTRARRSLDWRVVLLVDVSGSMEASVIYSAIMAAILSGLPAVSVHFVAFSTEIVDLSDRVADPLELLLEIAVGGGTHIAKAFRYARTLVTVPARTLVLCVSDFEEGGAVSALVEEVRTLVESGARGLGLAALDDHGRPRYARAVAEQVAAAGMPVAALTPLEVARWIAEQVR